MGNQGKATDRPPLLGTRLLPGMRVGVPPLQRAYVLIYRCMDTASIRLEIHLNSYKTGWTETRPDSFNRHLALKQSLTHLYNVSAKCVLCFLFLVALWLPDFELYTPAVLVWNNFC